MTLAEQIKSRVDKLRPPEQRNVLRFLDAMKKPRQPARQVRTRKARVSAAIQGIAGLWKDRNDLPKNSVDAVREIRSRMWSRGRHG